MADSGLTSNRSDAGLMHDENILHITITSTSVRRKTILETFIYATYKKTHTRIIDVLGE